MEKLYVVRKFIMAKSAEDAIKKERKEKVDSVWIDEEWNKYNKEKEIDENYKFKGR